MPEKPANGIRALQRDPPTSVVGRSLLHYERLDSTNDVARDLARAGHAEGVVVLAEEQIAGRGRLGRSWTAPAGSSLLMSLLLRPEWLAPAEVFAFTMLAGVALCEAVEQVAPLRAALKWPNDLMLPAPAHAHLRKAGGILCELGVEGGRISWVVIGIGVNVSWAPSGTVDDRDLALSATSLSAAAGCPVDRMALLWALLPLLDAGYAALRRGERAPLFESWRARLLLGGVVRVRLPQGELRGVAEGVEPSGALRLRDERGTLHVITAGEVAA